MFGCGMCCTQSVENRGSHVHKKRMCKQTATLPSPMGCYKETPTLERMPPFCTARPLCLRKAHTARQPHRGEQPS
jgi:hypothetical protein